MKTISIIGIICLISIPVLAGELADSFEEATARANAQERAAETRDYFTGTLLPYYAQNYARVLQSCFATIANPDNRPFSFVGAIGADGRLIRLYNDRETNVFTCMRESLKKDVFPIPPVSPYYLHIDMKFSDDVEPPQNRSAKDAPPLIVEPNKYAYTFGVPDNWEFSDEQARRRGAALAFFPDGGDFNSSNNVIYVNEIDGNCRGLGHRGYDRASEG